MVVVNLVKMTTLVGVVNAVQMMGLMVFVKVVITVFLF